MTKFLGILAGAALALTLNAAETTASNDHPRVVVGTFDSRAVAVAHVRSRGFADELHEQLEALERARDAGDGDEVARLEELGPAMQRRVHEQAFGATPVDDILERIRPRLSRIARDAGVDVLVSRWDLVYADARAEFVDVTAALVAEFEPDDATWDVIREILAGDPLPVEELRHLDD